MRFTPPASNCAATIGAELRDELGRAQSATTAGTDLGVAAKGARRLKSVALGLLAAGDSKSGAALAKAQFDAADNMTDRQGALAVLASLDEPQREAALDAFYDRFKDDALVVDKWFALQASAQRRQTIDEVERLASHPAFTLANPNRLRVARRDVRRQPMGVPPRVGARLSLRRRHDPRRGQAEPEHRRPAGAAVRPLAALRRASRRR